MIGIALEDGVVREHVGEPRAAGLSGSPEQSARDQTAEARVPTAKPPTKQVETPPATLQNPAAMRGTLDMGELEKVVGSVVARHKEKEKSVRARPGL